MFPTCFPTMPTKPFTTITGLATRRSNICSETSLRLGSLQQEDTRTPFFVSWPGSPPPNGTFFALRSSLEDFLLSSQDIPRFGILRGLRDYFDPRRATIFSR